MRLLVERTLQMKDPRTGEARDILVRLGMPERDPLPGGDFRVLTEVVGADEPYRRYCYGIDELQALLLASRLMGQILPTMVPKGAVLTWLGSTELGFECTVPPT